MNFYLQTHYKSILILCSSKILQGKYFYDIMKDLLGDGIFTVDGDQWREPRKVSSHEFSTKVLRDFSSVQSSEKTHLNSGTYCQKQQITTK